MFSPQILTWSMWLMFSEKFLATCRISAWANSESVSIILRWCVQSEYDKFQSGANTTDPSGQKKHMGRVLISVAQMQCPEGSSPYSLSGLFGEYHKHPPKKEAKLSILSNSIRFHKVEASNNLCKSIRSPLIVGPQFPAESSYCVLCPVWIRIQSAGTAK